jgi:hypothetical protein
LLSHYAESYTGLGSGDSPKYIRAFYEFAHVAEPLKLYLGTFTENLPYTGRELLIYWNNSEQRVGGMSTYEREQVHNQDKSGSGAWGTTGVAVSSVGSFRSTIYRGEVFDKGLAAIIPRDAEHLLPLLAYCSSQEFEAAVRNIDKKLAVTNVTLLKVPFDLEHWQQVASQKYPNGLPEPYSNDPTQWLFKGTVTDTTAPLQVAAARLLGYRWPEQVDDGLRQYEADDGTMPLVALPGVRPGAEQLRTLLATAYGTAWSAETQETLLAGVGYAGKSLDVWLREGFFEQHCRVFHNRPFLWQIWDGRLDGFSAIVNYHRLDGALLDKLTYTYLGAWIEQQRTAAGRGEAGADGRLVAALALQEKLKRIREGEPPYDIYVRWKSLHQQPLGWEPDLNDGVRLNIRPFVEAGVLRRKFTINWNKDRGANPDGSERLNDLHFTLDEKRRARVAAGVPV